MIISKKSILVSLIISLGIVFTGCSSNNTNTDNNETTQNVYCDNCGEESNRVTKYCPNCGEEVKWLSEKPTTDSEKKEENVTNDNSSDSSSQEEKNEVSYKDTYISKINALEESVDNSDNSSDLLTTADMREYEYARYQKWDDMLNEIYNLLKTQLSESEMNDLKTSQVNWIKYRDESAEIEASEFEGGTMQPVTYNSALATLTKQRCYELVNTYMK